MRPLLPIALGLALATGAVAQEAAPLDWEKIKANTFEAAYGFWGMMAAAGGWCVGKVENDADYAGALADWQAESAPVRAEVDAVFAKSGLPESHIAASEELAAGLMIQQLESYPDPATPCEGWLAQIRGGDYEARKALRYQFTMFREMGLLEP